MGERREARMDIPSARWRSSMPLKRTTSGALKNDGHRARSVSLRRSTPPPTAAVAPSPFTHVGHADITRVYCYTG
jgi:hypothetical protein